MAYVLGFFAADGYINLNKRGANFWCIQITDKQLLESIKRVIQAEHKISKRQSKDGQKPIYRLQIGSRKMCEDLRKIGFGERKTKSLCTPNVSDKVLPDFVRGYFDGDGNVWHGLIHKDRSRPTLAIRVVFTSASLEFLDNLKKRLKLLDINGSIIKGKGNYYRLQYSTLSSLKLYDFMYNGCIKDSLFLKRKKRIFEKFKSMRS
jgi:intein/homing endonuclease